YAFIVEEYGALGGIVIFLLYLWVFYRAGVIVRKCNRPSSALMVLGLALTITFQAFINMLVSVGLVPVTGQSLPLISLGGSSVIFTCIAFGMILSVSRESDEDEAAALAQLKIEEQNNARTEEPNEPDDEPDDTDDDAPGDTLGDTPGDDDPFIVVENPYAARNNLSPEKENINLYENNS
ncbi:MAG: FtsW/RodA/SpoVE family cell cycle protein, partial [Mucinivorans sp.]